MGPNAHSSWSDTPPHSPPADAPAPPSSEARLLNVRDALSYLEMVNVKFHWQDKPDVHNHFLDIMKDFKGKVINTSGGTTVDQHDGSLITVTTLSEKTTQKVGNPTPRRRPTRPSQMRLS